MNIGRLITFLTIFGLVFFSTTGKWNIFKKIIYETSFFLVVYGKEDKIETDVEVDEEDESVLRSDDTVTPASDILVRQD